LLLEHDLITTTIPSKITHLLVIGLGFIHQRRPTNNWLFGPRLEDTPPSPSFMYVWIVSHVKASESQIFCNLYVGGRKGGGVPDFDADSESKNVCVCGRPVYARPPFPVCGRPHRFTPPPLLLAGRLWWMAPYWNLWIWVLTFFHLFKSTGRSFFILYLCNICTCPNIIKFLSCLVV